MEAAIAMSRSELEKGQVTAALMELRQLSPYVQSNSKLGSAFLPERSPARTSTPARRRRPAKSTSRSRMTTRRRTCVVRRGACSVASNRAPCVCREPSTARAHGFGRGPFDAWRGGSFWL